ncbi:SLBB domain-containing protein [Chitinispirillales bacterium ANBcel5]|uniref:polysaccharide biosynthesis/export family protein n=1 Tax=Cellulosispirillum alkaliphilum TaxID=3039283 RepID=UPI002A54CE67|nr:SLBB domain-containing protein [Chitinispirillales bacterium ANBcel5]
MLILKKENRVLSTISKISLFTVVLCCSVVLTLAQNDFRSNQSQTWDSRQPLAYDSRLSDFQSPTRSSIDTQTFDQQRQLLPHQQRLSREQLERMRSQQQPHQLQPPRQQEMQPSIWDYETHSKDHDSALLFDTLVDFQPPDSFDLADTAALTYYGYDLFTEIPEVFKPSPIGPVDPGYTLAPGDVMRLSVWGQVEFEHELTVNQEGKVMIPVVGMVHVSGIPFEQLEQKLKGMLSRHFSGLTSSPPRTFMHLTVGRLRPIRVYFMGEVKQPGGYTVSSFANVFSALYSVGGPLKSGSLRSISVIRNDSTIANVDLYDYLLKGRSDSDVRLRNNDVIFVPPRGKTISISGAVFRPAIYELRPDDHLLSLLQFCGGPKSASNIEQATLRRIVPFEQRANASQMKKLLSIDLKRYLETDNDFKLYDQDSLHVYPLFSDLRNFVRLSGAVQYPGTYESSVSLYDLIFNHGKIIDNKTFKGRADLIRFNDDLVTTTVIPIDLKRLKSDQTYNMQMEPGDEVIVYELDVVSPTDLRITVDGEVREPGVYLMSSNMTVADAILRAGGFSRRAHKTRVDVFRPDNSGRNRLSRVFNIDLPDSLNYSSDKGREFVLEDRDRIVVRPDPNYREENYITIQGLVRYAGTYGLEERNERLSDLIDRAGGLMPDAYLKGASIIRDDKRLVVDFEAAYVYGRNREDVILQSGDSIYIPSRPNNVLIHGQVNNEGLYGYVEGQRLRSYLDRAGGVADSANFILVTKPNGETQKHSFRRFARNPKISDGSTIHVTKKPRREPRERTGASVSDIIKDTLAIITSAVTIIVLVQQINDD